MSDPRQIAPNRKVVARSISQLAGGLDNHAQHLEGQRQLLLKLSADIQAGERFSYTFFNRSLLGRLRWLLIGR